MTNYFNLLVGHHSNCATPLLRINCFPSASWSLRSWIFSILLITCVHLVTPAPEDSTENISFDHPLCREGWSTCSLSEERSLMSTIGTEVGSVLSENLEGIARDLDQFHHEFNEEIGSMLKTSQTGFHAMFKKTYGPLYEKHSSFFSSLFNMLSNYFYDESDQFNLETEMDTFFANLYRRMFQELNRAYSFDEAYMKCVETYGRSVNAFGDIPKKLQTEFKRSFTAAKVFSRSLKNASAFINRIKQAKLTPDCLEAYFRLTRCPKCIESVNRIPCYGFCTQTIRTCTLFYLQTIHRLWSPYIDKLTGLISRLETSFSIESAVGPLDIKVSEAVMNYQENGIAITTKIHQRCGKPKLGRRSAWNSKLMVSHSESSSSLPFSSSPSSQSSKSATNSELGPGGKSNLDLYLDRTKRNLRSLKDIWSHLPETICNSTSIRTQSSPSCWNQSDVSSHHSTGHNPDLPTKLLIQDVQQQWRNVNKILDAAYRGTEILEEDDPNGDGSGSGDGGVEDYDDDDGAEDLDEEEHPVTKPSTTSTTLQPHNVTSKVPGSSGISRLNQADKKFNLTATANPHEPARANPKDSGSLPGGSSLLMLTLISISMVITL